MTEKLEADEIRTDEGVATESCQSNESHGTNGCGSANEAFQVSRRAFLFGAGAGMAWLTMPAWLRARGMPARVQAMQADYEPQAIAKISDLVVGAPIQFQYPWEHYNSTNYLLKLGQRAGGGIGPDEDIVAFNSLCTHMGGPLDGKFNTDVGVAGPCPLHWTTFDLTRHGMVVAGHATMALPQITLEADGDDIFATGVVGLIFGYYDNSVDPTTI